VCGSGCVRSASVFIFTLESVMSRGEVWEKWFYEWRIKLLEEYGVQWTEEYLALVEQCQKDYEEEVSHSKLHLGK